MKNDDFCPKLWYLNRTESQRIHQNWIEINHSKRMRKLKNVKEIDAENSDGSRNAKWKIINENQNIVWMPAWSSETKHDANSQQQ